MAEENPDPHPQQPVLAHVAVKAPEFMETSPTQWFSILEAQFELSHITVSSTKFFNALSHLPASVVVNINQLVLDTKNYEELKQAVVSSYEKSKPEILEKLMSSTTLTGRPSLYLNEISSLASKINAGDDIVRHRFIQSLPQTVSTVIAAQSNLDLQSLGKLADDLMSYFNHQPINAVYSRKESRSSYSNRGQSPDRINDHQIPIGLRPFNKDQRPKICRAHLYFAEKAKYCKPWCRWYDKSTCVINPSSRPSSRSSSPVNQTN